ncbi:hypothetical protein HDU80_002161, partial [Chytriomyces hyalinus]
MHLLDLPIGVLQQIFLHFDPFKIAKYRRVCRSFNTLLTGSPFSNLTGLVHIGHFRGSAANRREDIFCFVTPASFGEDSLRRDHAETAQSFKYEVIHQYSFKNLEVVPINPTKSNNATSLLDLFPSEVDGPMKTIHLTGPLPNTVDNLKQLTSLDFGGSCGLQCANVNLMCRTITGPIPREFGNLVNLKTLNLSHMLLDGAIPDSFGNLVNLEVHDLSSAMLTGAIPGSLGHLINLVELRLEQNQLSGKLPDIFGEMAKLHVLSLDHNNFEGLVPHSISGDSFADTNDGLWFTSQLDLLSLGKYVAALKNLECLQLDENDLEGPLPAGIGGLTNLKILSLCTNQLCGFIPDSISGLVALKELNLSRNSFIGGIPDSITSLVNLTHLFLECNRLGGRLMAEIGLLGSLEFVNLSYNRFCGEIPESVGNLTHLQTLDLSHNQLTGEIPRS